MLSSIEKNLLVVVAILQKKKKVVWVYLIAFVTMDVRVQMFRHLSLSYYLHENVNVHDGGFAALRADVLTQNENGLA